MHVGRFSTLLIITFIIFILIPDTYGQPNWARKGVYVEYSVKVSVSKTDLAESLGKLNELLDGYIDATIRYVLKDYDQNIFILEEHVLKETRGTGTDALSQYIHIVSQGEANTIETSSGYELVYHWYFKYRGVVFPKIRDKPYPLNLYVYMDLSQNPSSISKSSSITIYYENVEVTVKESVKAIYDKATGFLDKLEYVQAFLVNELNAIIVSVSIVKTGSTIPVVFGRAMDIDTLIALLAGSVLAGVVAMIVFYQRVKKELG